MSRREHYIILQAVDENEDYSNTYWAQPGNVVVNCFDKSPTIESSYDQQVGCYCEALCDISAFAWFRLSSLQKVWIEE